MILFYSTVSILRFKIFNDYVFWRYMKGGPRCRIDFHYVCTI